ITLQVKERNLRPGAASRVTLEVHNQGPGTAYGVLVEMAGGEGYTVQVGSQLLSALPPHERTCVDFIFVASAPTIRGKFTARYADFAEADALATCEEDLSNVSLTFRSIPNPYVPGLPLEVGSELFLGREDIFKFVAQNLSSAHRRVMVLTGQRRMGKTSLLKQLPLRLPSQLVPVFVDCQGLECRGLGNLLFHLAYIIGDFLEADGVPVPIPPINDFQERPLLTFERDFLRPLGVALGDRTLLLLIDEFQALDEAVEAGDLTPGHLGFLRSLMQHQDKLTFLFSGLQKPFEQARDHWQPVFNIALRREVGLLEPQHLRELIEKPVAGLVHYHAGAVEELIRLTCGQPYLTQLFCDRLINRLNDQRETEVRVPQIHQVIPEIFSAGVNHFHSLWDDLGAREKIVLIGLSGCLSHHQFATLSSVTRYLRERGMMADLDDLTTVLQQLLGLDLIRYANSQPPGYTFSVLLFRLWIEKEMLHSLLGSSIKWPA
ncbi:MAG TPA: ATP-binding protein, partial [Candidatus Xenobia bacterium]